MMKTRKMNNQQRILDISKRLGLSHISSCLSVLPILEEIYEETPSIDRIYLNRVILSGAHSHLAHLILQEEYGYIPIDWDIEELIKKDIHCNRASGCNVSGGSLGHGIGIGIGMALADSTTPVYVVTTDGALGEGSEWEALNLAREMELKNLKIIVNMNGYSATKQIDKDTLTTRLLAFYPDIDIRYTYNTEEFDGIFGHYKTI